MNAKRFLFVPIVALAGALVLTGCSAEPSSVAGVITESEELPLGRPVPDFPVVIANGKETRFSEIREPTTIVAFVNSTGDKCCWLNPELVSLAQELKDRRIGVAQISEPTGKCPHGPGCVATCDLKDPHLLSLCDAERRAWEAYRKPRPNTAVLLNYRGEVELVAPLAELDTVANKAREVAAKYEAWWRSAYEG
jgi:hypothetical protein